MAAVFSVIFMSQYLNVLQAFHTVVKNCQCIILSVYSISAKYFTISLVILYSILLAHIHPYCITLSCISRPLSFHYRRTQECVPSPHSTVHFTDHSLLSRQPFANSMYMIITLRAFSNENVFTSLQSQSMKSPTQRDSLSITHHMIQPVHNTQYTIVKGELHTYSKYVTMYFIKLFVHTKQNVVM